MQTHKGSCKVGNLFYFIDVMLITGHLPISVNIINIKKTNIRNHCLARHRKSETHSLKKKKKKREDASQINFLTGVNQYTLFLCLPVSHWLGCVLLSDQSGAETKQNQEVGNEAGKLGETVGKYLR